MYEPNRSQRKVFLPIGGVILFVVIFSSHVMISRAAGADMPYLSPPNLRLVDDKPVGWVRIDNHTEHDVTVYYRSEHDEHEHSLGHVHARDAETYSLTDCDHHAYFRAIDEHGSVWTNQLHVDCGATTSWTVGHQH